MLVTRIEDAKPYEAHGHHGMVAVRLQGMEATQTDTVWTGLSTFLPGGGAEEQTSAVEKLYIVLEGALTVTVNGESTTLKTEDSCVIPAGEARMLENRTNHVARMLVVMPAVKA